MTKKQSLLCAMAAAALVAPVVTQAQQAPYVDQDLLLNFRSINSQSPPNVTVDVGNVTAFLAKVNTAGGTAVLDIPGTTHGFTDQFSASDLLDTLGEPTTDLPIGFTACAAQSNTSTLWLTRVISGPNANGAGLTPSARQSQPAQATPAQQIYDIGFGYGADGTQLGTGNAATVSAGDSLSYSTQTVDGAGNMTYKGSETITPGAGGYLEGILDGSQNIYLALWQVPVSVGKGGGTPDTYLGYFTFKPSGELDFATQGTTVISVPNLKISGGSTSVVISWPNTGSYTLQQNSNLALTNGWTTSGYPVTTNAGGTGTNTVTITPPAGTSFFRLHYP